MMTDSREGHRGCQHPRGSTPSRVLQVSRIDCGHGEDEGLGYRCALRQEKQRRGITAKENRGFPNCTYSLFLLCDQTPDKSNLEEGRVCFG